MPYRSATGRPGRRVQPLGSIINDAALQRVAERGFQSPRRPATPAQYGRDCEKDAEKKLRKAGWMVTRSHLSRGAADLVATKLEDGILATTRYVQVKSCQVFRATFCNRGVIEILQAPPVQQRCVYGYVCTRGHVVTITIAHDESFSVTGKEPYASEVQQAVARLMRLRGRHS